MKELLITRRRVEGFAPLAAGSFGVCQSPEYIYFPTC